MQDINPIYHNDFGVAFQWKKNAIQHTKKIQMVFRDTGLLLSKQELIVFSKNIQCTREGATLCKDCKQNESCKAILLETPAPQVTLAMNQKELDAVHDLVEGTLFQLNLDQYLGNLFKD